MISLVSPSKMQSLAIAIANLEASIMSEWSLRFYSYQEHYLKKCSLFSMRNGSGDDFYMLFTPDGIMIKGFCHEHQQSSDLVNQMPMRFQQYASEPSFDFANITFLLWSEGNTWQKAESGVDRDGSTELLHILDGKPETYQKWASEYYERDISLNIVAKAYEQSAK